MRYTTTVVGVFIGVIGRNETPYIGINLETKETDKPKTLTAKLWLTEKAIESSVEKMYDMFGWTGNDLSELNGTEKYNGITLYAETIVEEYNGKPHENVLYLGKKPRTPKIKPDTMNGIALRFGSKISEIRSKSHNTPQNVPESAPVEHEDSDLPF